MQLPLDKKTVLVTAGARRVGAAICRRLHAAGANVMVNYLRSGKAARGLVAEFNAQRANSAAMIKADLLHADAPARLIKTTLQTFGRLDVVVNNASSFYPTPVGQLNEAAWHDLIGTNLKAPLFVAQAAAAELKKRRGCIVNIVDIHADLPMKDYVVYTVAKAGLAALTRSLARELGPDVRVNGEWRHVTFRERERHEMAIPPSPAGAWTITIRPGPGFRPQDRDPRVRDARNLGIWVEVF